MFCQTVIVFAYFLTQLTTLYIQRSRKKTFSPSGLTTQLIERKFVRKILLFESMRSRSRWFKKKIEFSRLRLQQKKKRNWNFQMLTLTFSCADSPAYWKTVNGVGTVHIMTTINGVGTIHIWRNRRCTVWDLLILACQKSIF